MIYKILTQDEWLDWQQHGQYQGSAADRRDGFIHLSSADQLNGTLQRHFRGQAQLLLIGVDPRQLGEGLRYEQSRAGQLFPHVYGALPLSLVRTLELISAP